jgi:hypothetical protein
MIHGDVFEGLLADARKSYDGYTMKMNDVETTNSIKAGVPDYRMGFEQIENMM